MNTRKKLFWILSGALLLVGALVPVWFGLQGQLPWQRGDVYSDPQGRFSLAPGSGWEQVQTDQPYMQLHLSNPPMTLYVLVIPTPTTEEAFAQATDMVGMDRALLTGGDVAQIQDWQAYSTEDSAGLIYGLAGQVVEDQAYVMVVRGEQPGENVDSPVVMRAMQSFKIAAKKEIVIKSYADVEALVRDRVDSHAGSISVAVLHGDQIVYTYAYGQANPLAGVPADTGSIYRFGSMTKPFTATALMQLVEQGKVDLDAWPGKYVPEFPKTWQVTVRQLLDHSACLPESISFTDGWIVKPGEEFPPLADVFRKYVQDFPTLGCEPGAVSQYSNGHYLSLARIIEEVSGEPYDTYVVDHLLVPLKMDSTRFRVVEPDARYAKGQWPADKADELVAMLDKYRGESNQDLILGEKGGYVTMDNFRVLPPWGGLFGTPSDITHFLQMHMDGGSYGGVQIVKPETVAAMQQMQLSTTGDPLGFGLSWMLGQDESGKFYQHSGGGHTIESIMIVYPDLDLGVVIMSNVNGSGAEKIAHALVTAWKREK